MAQTFFSSDYFTGICAAIMVILLSYIFMRRKSNVSLGRTTTSPDAADKVKEKYEDTCSISSDESTEEKEHVHAYVEDVPDFGLCPHFGLTSTEDNATSSDIEDPEGEEVNDSKPKVPTMVDVRAAKKVIEHKMTEEEKCDERRIQEEQMENIFKLMYQQQDKFGMSSVGDIHDQMKLYM